MQHSFSEIGGTFTSTDAEIIAINNSGDLLEKISDTYYTVHNNLLSAFVAPADFGAYTLSGINSEGQIIGSVGNGGFIATPIPEPITVVLLGSGFLATIIGSTKRRRSKP
ncbi:MAG: hypothetical protein NVS2B16_26920 [Chloroflexota bacterium]